MEPDAKHININPELRNWRVGRTVDPVNDLEFCDAWLISVQPGDRQHADAVEPLDTGSRRGLRLSLGGDQWVRLANRIRPGADEQQGRWRLTMRLRGVLQDGRFPKLDAASVLRLESTGIWVVHCQLLRETPLSQQWIELKTSFDFSGRPGSTSHLRRFWSKCKVILGFGAPPPQHSLALALQFSRAGMVEIASCKLEDEQLKAVLGYNRTDSEVLEEVASSMDLRLAPYSHAQPGTPPPRAGVVPIADGEIIALLDGRLLGWVEPGPPHVQGTVRVDGEPIGAIGGAPFNGAEIALLGAHRDAAFAIKVPEHLLKGKVLRVDLFDEFTDASVEGSEVSLMFHDGLHVPSRDQHS